MQPAVVLTEVAGAGLTVAKTRHCAAIGQKLSSENKERYGLKDSIPAIRVRKATDSNHRCDRRRDSSCWNKHTGVRRSGSAQRKDQAGLVDQFRRYACTRY